MLIMLIFSEKKIKNIYVKYIIIYIEYREKKITC